jgi:integral membrane protein (TIGR01906 family)
LKIPGIAAKWVFILCLPVLYLSASLAWAFNSEWIIEYGFQKYDVVQTTGLSNAELDKIGESWISYINSGDEYWHIRVSQSGHSFELFTTEEQIHFRDVKQLIRLDYRVLSVTLVLVLGYTFTSIFWRKGRYRRNLARSVIWGGGISLVLILIFGVASYLDFDQLFLLLHQLIFTNPYWSAEGYMLLLFPGGFWFDAALICIGFMAGLALVLGFSAGVYLRLKKPA